MESILNLYSYFNLSGYQILLLMLVGMLLGMAKAGVKGVGTASIPIAALIFGAKESTGILLPILIMSDLGAVSHYYKETKWPELAKLLPFAVIGVIVATWVGQYINGDSFQFLMGILIMICLLLLLLSGWLGDDLVLEKHHFLGSLTGVGLGFTTMIGNAAGPLMNIYMLVIKMPKTVFIGTSAMFFFIINVIKIPFHVFIWKTITWKTFLLGMTTLPAVVIGLVFGVYLVKLMSERYFRLLVIFTTALSGMVLLFA